MKQKKITVNIHEFLRRFNDEYQFLYDSCDRVAGYQEAVDEFDFRMKNDKPFNKAVQEFVTFRQDFITSDRECAAYMFTWADMVG